MTAQFHDSKLMHALLSGDVALGVWGCGHIGASAMYHFSQKGVRCAGYDIAPARVAEIRQGRFLSTDIVPEGALRAEGAPVHASTRLQDMRDEKIGVHIVAVPTERGAEPSSASIEAVMPAICDCIRATDLGDLRPLIVIESTVQPTWLDTVVLPALHAAGLQPGVDVLVGAAPRRDWFSGGEHTLKNLPRIVGANSPEATQELVDLYSLVCDEVVPARDAYHAAFTKVMENLIRFQGLALANSLSLAFPQYDMTHILALASSKWNIPLYHPSMGIGGHCIPLAPRYALEEGGRDNPYLAPISAAVDFNENYFARLYDVRLRDLLRNCRSIAILGLAYTPDAKMDKLSPALDAVRVLKDTPKLRIHDPYWSATELEDICKIPVLDFPDDLEDVDGIVLVTGHRAYRETPVERYLRPGTVVVDNFGTWRNREFASGVTYYEVGRRDSDAGLPALVSPERVSTETA